MKVITPTIGRQVWFFVAQFCATIFQPCQRISFPFF